MDAIKVPDVPSPKGVCWAQADTMGRCTYPVRHSYPHQWEQKPPNTYRAFMTRFNENQEIWGTGIDNMRMRTPCPFCAAPNFLTFKLTDVRKAMQEPTTCSECKRGCIAVFHVFGRSIDFELVQTSGPDQPSWAKTRMRRAQPGDPTGYVPRKRKP